MEQIKVVWLCHFSNEAVRNIIPSKEKRPLYSLMRKILHLPPKNNKGGDFAPWVTAGIDEIKKREDIELHVICPQTNLRKNTYSCHFDNVYYYFYNPNWTLLLMHIIKSPQVWQKLQNSSHYANKFIKKIKPDIINLIGAENPYHACAALDIDKSIPIFVTLQTIYTNPANLEYRPNDKKSKNWYIDELIHKQLLYFGATCQLHHDLLLKDNPQAIVFKIELCATPMPDYMIVDKQYDFVNFALNHGLKKGTQDSIIALAKVKKVYSNVRLNIVGGCDEFTKQELIRLINDNGLQDNVIFTPFFQQIDDLMQHIQKSRFALLPVKIDYISGTTIQAMYYGLPVVTYKTAGAPTLNKENQSVLIAEMDNIDDLAEKMLTLLDNEVIGNTLRNNAKIVANTFIGNNQNKISNLIEIYNAVIKNKNNNEEIPQHLLYKN